MNQQTMVSPFATERAKLERQLERLDQKRQAITAALESVLAAERCLAALDESEVGGGATIGIRPAETASAPKGQRSGKRFVAIARVLREADGPLSVPEIAQKISGRGDTNTKKLRDILHAILRRKPALFEKLNKDGQVVWRLKEKATADALHDRAKEEAHEADANRNGRAAPAGDLAGRTIADAARIILTERLNQPTLYSELANEMRRRGYRSGRSADFPDYSVASVLNGRPEGFENLGGGTYRLKET